MCVRFYWFKVLIGCLIYTLKPLLSPIFWKKKKSYVGWFLKTSSATYEVKFHSYQSLWPFKQSVRQVKGQTQSVSFSEGDKIGNPCQYWLSLCTYILPTGWPEAEYTRTADFIGPFISPYTTKSNNERRKDSEVKKTSAELHEKVSEEEE